jgi:hypothetical protein
MSEIEINTKIFPLKINDNKYVVGDVIINAINNLLSPFQQVDLFLNGIYEDTRVMNSSNTMDRDGKPLIDKATAETKKQRIYANHTFQHKFKGAGKKQKRKTKKHSKK